MFSCFNIFSCRVCTSLHMLDVMVQEAGVKALEKEFESIMSTSGIPLT